MHVPKQVMPTAGHGGMDAGFREPMCVGCLPLVGAMFIVQVKDIEPGPLACWAADQNGARPREQAPQLIRVRGGVVEAVTALVGGNGGTLVATTRKDRQASGGKRNSSVEGCHAARLQIGVTITVSRASRWRVAPT